MAVRRKHRSDNEASKVIPQVGQIFKAPASENRRIFIAVGFTGLVRVEWMFARYGQIVPCNWSMNEYKMWQPTFGPLGFLVAEQRNISVQLMLETGFEWMLFIDHDVILPLDFFLTTNERMLKAEIPMWSGLYFTKSVPSEPLIYRGLGSGYFTKWKLGDQVWVDGIPMGCTVIHRSLLQVASKHAEPYESNGMMLKRVFETPQKAIQDPATKAWSTATGTEDLHFCHKIIDRGYFKEAGWKKYHHMKYPFMIDTRLFCGHIDPNGIVYPAYGEEKYFERPEIKGKIQPPK